MEKNVIKLNSYKIILGNKTKKTLIESMLKTTIIIILQREKIILKTLNTLSIVVHVYTIYYTCI